MERLGDIVEVSGTGISGLTAKKLDRHKDVCIYERDDDVWEVFLVKVFTEGEMFGRSYPEREGYPCNEDFGKTAWCFSNKKFAYDRYYKLIDRGVDGVGN